MTQPPETTEDFSSSFDLNAPNVPPPAPPTRLDRFFEGLTSLLAGVTLVTALVLAIVAGWWLIVWTVVNMPSTY